MVGIAYTHDTFYFLAGTLCQDYKISRLDIPL